MDFASPVTRYQLAEIGALLAEPARAAILLALTDGGARPASELALLARVAPATASAHLRKLLEGGLLDVLAQGRHRYYRLASDDVAHMLETLVVARSASVQTARGPCVAPALARARTCYRHLAGRLGVDLFERLRTLNGLRLDADSIRLSAHGVGLLRDAGLLENDAAIEHLRGRSCLDWTERRFHLAGPLGCHLTRRLFEMRWLRRASDARTLALGVNGRSGLRMLGLEWRRPGA